MRCLLPPSFRHPSSFSRCSRFSVASSPSFGAAGDRKLEGKGGGGWCKTKDDSPLLRGKGGGDRPGCRRLKVVQTREGGGGREEQSCPWGSVERKKERKGKEAMLVAKRGKKEASETVNAAWGGVGKFGTSSPFVLLFLFLVFFPWAELLLNWVGGLEFFRP